LSTRTPQDILWTLGPKRYGVPCCDRKANAYLEEWFIKVKPDMKPCMFVTGNPNKVIEVNAILGEVVPVQSLALDIPEIQGTLEEIATEKCRRAAKIVRGHWFTLEVTLD
jgi:hypothetical protein